MREQLLQWLIEHGYPHSDLVVNLVMIALIIATTLLLHAIIHYGIFRLLANKFKASKLLFLNILVEQRLLSNIALAIQAALLTVQLRIWLPESVWRDGFLSIFHIIGLIFTLLAVFALLDTLQTYLFRKNLAQHFPVRGLVQTVKLIASIGIGILVISLVLGQSPLILISGLGAMTAVLMLVFKDPIMGLVAGIQLSANRMLQIGDWLEMPKYSADGDVTDIGLTTVKVRNFDNTITTLPTSALISDSFKNWRGMSESGGRRIKRSISIDATSVHFLSKDEIGHMRHSKLLTQYLDDKTKEISAQNSQEASELESYLNGRHLTNIGTFRAYLLHYLRAHPRIREDMTVMVRQLAPEATGIPLEIYCFTNTVAWAEYEGIQADIFDHVYAVIQQFNLRLYQSPSGYDMQQMGQYAAIPTAAGVKTPTE